MEHHVGLIGYGYMAGRHVKTAAREDINMPVTAVFDVREARREAAAADGFRVYDNLEDFLADGSFDLVVVATPNHLHCHFVCATLEAGYHVMTEKPVAMSSEEVKKMIAASEASGRIFTVHQNRRFDGDYLLFTRTVDSGLIGRPLVIESRIHSTDGSGAMFNWRAMADHGGGMLLDWGVHMLDQIVYYAGRPETVFAVVRPMQSEEVDDYSKIILTYGDGLTVQVEVTTYSPIALPRWYAIGERGAVRVDSIGSDSIHVRRIREDRKGEKDALAYRKTDWEYRHQGTYAIDSFEEFDLERGDIDDDWGNIYKNLRDVMDGRAESLVKHDEILTVMEIIEAAFESSKRGETVHLA